MFQKMIEAAVQKELDRRTVRPDKKLTLEGYHPLPEIMGCIFEWLLIPFNGTEILVEVKYPRSTQLPEADKLQSIIEAVKEKKTTRQDLIDMLNLQEEACRAILNKPTFDELEKEIHGKDNIRKNKLKTIAELKNKVDEVKNDFEKQTLKKEIEELELYAGYSLPDDAMDALTKIAYGIGVSDIQRLTKDKLLLAYSKAKHFGGRPSDYISGLFTDGDRENIDNYATLLGTKK